ncbi:hypothetical protein NDU88_007137 [Pleurodeles waltl]|uniref:Uncharacterized protein n=1 Tax=Pleurodeles waltl TaxID=8319 RepID=A0AAV7NS75_PLEWA|nr:hypothetical protein NDU88_007137 [Pleurodeles waltl]
MRVASRRFPLAIGRGLRVLPARMTLTHRSSQGVAGDPIMAGDPDSPGQQTSDLSRTWSHHVQLLSNTIPIAACLQVLSSASNYLKSKARACSAPDLTKERLMVHTVVE